MNSHLRHVSTIAILCTIFIMIINWSVEFKMFGWSDFRQLITLISATGILMTLANPSFDDKHALVVLTRFNLFVSALTITLFSIISLSSTNTPIDFNQRNQQLLHTLKPLAYAMLLYAISYNLIEGRIASKRDPKVTLDTLNLSKRELEVAELVLLSLSNKQIGKQLYISELTVKKHMQSILKKSSCQNRNEFIERIVNP